MFKLFYRKYVIAIVIRFVLYCIVLICMVDGNLDIMLYQNVYYAYWRNKT